LSEGFDIEPVETGLELLTAAVTEGLTPDGREALKALVQIKPEFASPSFLAGVARDVAMDIETLDAIISRHGLTHAQYDFIAEHNAFYKATLLQQVTEWNKIASAQDRLKAQAAAALEAQFPTIAGRMGKPSEKLADVVEAAKLFAKVAGVDATAPGTGHSGERFEINIDLGADQRITLRSTPLAETSAGQVVANQIPQIAKAA
jgi:hypothetical protein